MGRLNGAWSQPTENYRFSRPLGSPLTRSDLERYAMELNEGPMKGWHVARMANGSYFLDRNEGIDRRAPVASRRVAQVRQDAAAAVAAEAE